jgi:hypothetical protein
VELTDLTAYLVLAAIAHSAAGVATDLVSIKDTQWRERIQDWLSSSIGIGLAFGTGVDLLAELGITVIWPPAGLLVTGLLLGQGTKFGIQLLRSLPGRGGSGGAGAVKAQP